MRITLLALVVASLMLRVAHAQDDEPVPSPAPAPAPAPVVSDPADDREPSPEPQPTLVPVPAEPPRTPTPFDRGRISLGFGFSTQRSYDQRYYVLGGGFGYYVLRGLEPSVQAVHWFGGEPTVTKLSPALRYVFVGAPVSLKPYVGAFYSHWFLSGDGAGPDLDTVGGRAGLVSYGSGGLVIGLGIVYERVISECTEECDEIYPDITLSYSL